jgi:hypothetical protein
VDLFVNSASDFHLRTNSPAIDRGGVQAAVAADADGIGRPLDGNNDGTNSWDVGAYEFVNAQADSDGDGMRDAWEVCYGLRPTTNDAAPDADGDGMGNLGECLAGTDPTNANSRLAIESLEWAAQGTGVVVRWSSATGRHYRVESATNLFAGFAQAVKTNVAAVPPLNTVTDAAAGGASPLFYRIRLE